MYTESPPLNDAHPEHDVDTAERTSSNRVHRLRPGAFRLSSGFKNTQVASDGPSITRRIIRTLSRFSVAVLIGVGATAGGRRILIICAFRSHQRLAARSATSLRFRFVEDIIARYIDLEMKLRGGTRSVSMLPLRLARFG